MLLKISKLWSLILVRTIYPLAIGCGVDWPRAYLAVARELRKEHKRLLSGTIRNQKVLNDLEERIISCFEKFISREPCLDDFPDWLAANEELAMLYWFRFEIGKCHQICKRMTEVYGAFARGKEWDQTGFVFIPAGFALGSVGAYEDVAAYIKAEKMSGKPEKKKFLLLRPGMKVNNPCFLDYWSRYVTVLKDPNLVRCLSSVEKLWVVPLYTVMPVGEKTLFTHHLTLGLVHEHWQKEKRPPLLTLSPEDEERGRACLSSLGVPEDAWFVCLHVREAWKTDKNSSVEDFRNADIGTYSLAIEAIIAAGGWVIRLGDSGMVNLAERPGFIDYAHSKVKSDWMDVFLCAKCRFFIGTSSGPLVIAQSFGVPVAVTNFLPAYAIYCFGSEDRFLPRLCWSVAKKRYLSFEELLLPPVGMAVATHSYDALGLKVVPNEPQEIKDFIMEMLGKDTIQAEDDLLLTRFRLLTKECAKAYIEEECRVNARMGRAFLRKYAALLTRVDD